MRRRLRRYPTSALASLGFTMLFLPPVSGDPPPPALDELRRGRFAVPAEPHGGLSLVCWNVARGANLEEVVRFLRAESPDVCVLQEADVGARRTGWRDVPAEIARRLGYDYVFGAEFLELGAGAGGSPAWHGQATLSRFPIVSAKILRYQMQSDFWEPRWYLPNLSALQRRQGGRMALRVTIDAGDGQVVLYNTHFESRGPESRRAQQMSELLDDVRSLPPGVAVVIAGDLNTRTRPSSTILLASELGFNSAILPETPTTAPRARSLATMFYPGRFLPFFLGDRTRLARTLDWVLVREPATVVGGEVRASATGSDHYPLVVRVCLRKSTVKQLDEAHAEPAN